jgi:hypothetical protein
MNFTTGYDVHGDEHLTVAPRGFDFCDGCDSDTAAFPESELTRYRSHLYCEDHYPKCRCGEPVWEPGEGEMCRKCEMDAAIDCLRNDPGDAYSKQVLRMIAKETR